MPRALADRRNPSSPASAEGRLAASTRRFASPALRAALARRSAELLGLLLGLGGLGLLVALVSYNPADPSLSTATDQAPTNLAGPAGAITADLLLQSFGWAGLLPVAVMLAWAWRLATHKGLAPFLARVAAVLAALPMLAAAFALAPLPAGQPALPGPGGGAGVLLAEHINGFAGAILGPFGSIVGQVGVLALAGSLSFAALGIPLLAWRQAGRAAGHAARGGAGLTARLMRRSLASTVAPPPQYASRWEADEEDEEAGPSLGARLVAPFRAVSGAMGGLFTRGSEAPSPQLAAMLRAADAAAAEAPPARGRQTPVVPPPGRAVPSSRRSLSAPAPAPEAAEEDEENFVPEMPAPRVVPPAPAAAAPRMMDRLVPRRAKPAPEPQPHGPFQLPPLDLLAPPPARRATGPSEEQLQGNARQLESVLEDYGVRGRIVEVRPGPVVTLYELEPAPGTKSARVIGLADDIARSMSVMAVRIATVPGRNVIGIELPNAKREMVYFSEMLIAEEWSRQTGKLPLALGKDIGGAPVIADLARMPHLLIAGTTGSGKSVGINTMILSLLYRFSPDECRFIMIDPKMLELSVYDRIPHLLAPVVTEPPKAIGALKWTVREMERRYRAMSQLGVRNIGGYNEKVQAAQARGEVLSRRVQTGFDPDTGKPVFEEQPLALAPLPLIVVVIDEMADLMIVAGKEIEAAVQRLAQMARAAGIHVIMATQRPSVDVITGTIKANFPTRISFQVTSKIDSRTILGEMGAEQLLGQGDMLHMAGGGRVSRVHGPFVSDAEVERVVEWLREQGEPAYVEEVTESEEEEGESGLSGIAGASDGEKGLFDQAVALVTREGKASTSFIQRHLSIGYNRAAKLIEQMEKEGVVGPANHVGKREVLARRSDED
ncbi:DNA translocase FtsK 4TM domain-containing protein [Roseomonas sp. E05]|uniref:FtsK/SpoIIIE family DNA translocase n=1 Tax=Roseomonas sp. E05 TaxID=3046310 RepID=UPI0024B898BF|nr:DNA translocase FtsK [Roseomonas sp. E05]MDJ0387900.1 DNA translocase FtsK 4TM domain-containing protein [Roseomonas sp. E05]